MQGSILSASTGTWSGSPTSFAFQWLRCDTGGGACSPFASGNGLATYTLLAADVGSTIRVAVTASSSYGSATSTSAPTGVVAPPPVTAPTPSIAITTPAANATIGGNVTFAATVASATPQRVELTIDGGLPWIEYWEPYVYNGDGNTLDTKALANGSHTLRARAFFADGTSVLTSASVNVQNTVATSTAGTTTPVRGIGALRFGDTYAKGTGYDRYDTIIVGYGDVDKAAALAARSLVYKGGVDVTDSPNTDPGQNTSGVGYKQALANNWLLKDAAGNYIKPTGYNHWFGDVGDPAFQKAWVENVSTWLIAHKADGVFIDNVLCSFSGLASGVLPAKYPTASSWADAQAAFIAYVGPALRARGLYAAANVYCYGPDDGSANNAWWNRVLPYLDGGMTEMFEQNPTNLAEPFFDAPTLSWKGNWRGKLGVIEAAQSLGKDAFALTWGSSADTRMMTYTRASYLLVWNGKGGSFVWNPTDGSDPWNTAWTATIGSPVAAMSKVGYAYVRDYSGGYVVVNPSQTTTTTALPAGLVTLSGAPAGSAVTLAPATAAIFTK